MVLLPDPMPSPFLTQVFAQELTGLWIQQPYLPGIPLNLNPPPDPAGGSAVVGSLDLDTAVQMDCPLAVLIKPEGLHGQR
jgi:hypothetical protein